ncbi:hypothetical protein K493DRAFT_318401, partial [Basidiobolus meristosporus CBS 931.73]
MRCLYSLITLVAAIQLVRGDEWVETPGSWEYYEESHGSEGGYGNWKNQGWEDNQDYGEKKCYAPATQAPFNNKAVTFNEKYDPANYDTVVRGPGYTAQSLTQAGWGPGKEVRVAGYKFTLPQWAKGKNDNWIEQGQKVKVTSVPGATRLGFLLSSDMGNFRGKYTIVYTDCSRQVEQIGSSDWKWKIELAPGTKIAVNGLAASNGGDVRIYIAEATLDPSREIAYLEFPTAKEIYDVHPYTKGVKGHIHVFALSTKKEGY